MSEQEIWKTVEGFIDGIKNTAYGWSLHLGLEEKRIGRFAKKHTYEETIEYIKSFIK